MSDTNLLFETTNGTSWTPVPDIHSGVMDGFCAIHVRDAQHIYGAGRVRGQAHVAISVNGGANWSITNLTDAGLMGGLMDVYFKDANNGFVVGMDTGTYTTSCTFPYHGAIARTTNGGLSWHVVANTPINCSYFWKMSWPSANVGYASLQQNATESTIVFYKTTDGGATWTSNGIPHTAIGVSSGQSWFVQGIGFASETEGWMGGSVNTGLTFEQCFIRTTDGGLTWSPAGYDNTRGMNRIRFLTPTFGYGSGRRVHVFRIPLAIAAPPTNQTVAAGATATFYVTAYGTAPLAYQWRLAGTNLPNANASSHAVPNAQPANAGNYDVIVSDYSGSLTSSVAALSLTNPPPSLTVQPQSRFVYPGSNVTFSVNATGTAPLTYQWRRNKVNLANATNGTLTLNNVGLSNSGAYAVAVSNPAGSTVSDPAFLYVAFADDFDSYVPGITNFNANVTVSGYKFLFNAPSGPVDFQAVLGFDYSLVTVPTNIASAPHSTGGTRRGLFLAVNKNDGNAQLTAVNLHPEGQLSGGNFELKCDVWMNWTNLGTSTEHALFGINHAGIAPTRIQLADSDGLFFAMSADGITSSTGTTARDFSAFRGTGTGGMPFLMLTNNTVFGPTPPLGGRFDNLDSGLTALFPAKAFPSFTTPNGSAGNGWVQVRVRQIGDRITWLLNNVAVAQYTNALGATNGTVLLGLNDHFASIGDAHSFLLLDNLRVEPVAPPAITLASPAISGGNFSFSFATEPYESYTVQWATNLPPVAWMNYTNLTGDGSVLNVSVPWSANPAESYFRVRQP